MEARFRATATVTVEEGADVSFTVQTTAGQPRKLFLTFTDLNVLIGYHQELGQTIQDYKQFLNMGDPE